MKTSIDFDEMTKQIVKDLRAPRSQAEMSKQLGSSFNIVNRWETGSREFYWKDFLALCQIMSLDIARILEETTGFTFSPMPDDSEVFAILISVLEAGKVEEDFSKGQVHRLKSGVSKLRFRDFLRLIEMGLGRTERLVRLLFKDQISSSLSAYFVSAQDYAKLVGEDVSFSLLRACITLQAYKSLPEHSTPLLASLIGISEVDVENRLKILEEIGSIEKSGSHYQPRAQYVDIRLGGRESSARTMNRWRRIISDYAESPLSEKKQLKSAFFLYSTNSELEKKIFDLTNKFYVELSCMVRERTSEEKAGDETVRFLSLEFFSPLSNGMVLEKP